MPALTAEAATKYPAAHGRRMMSNAIAVPIGTTKTPTTRPRAHP